MKRQLIFLAVFLFFAVSAFATGGPPDCPPGHENIESCDDDGGGIPGPEGPPGPAGPPGPQGEPGVDGQDGADGQDGVDGRDGIAGINGLNGRDGVVDQKWITETRNWQSNWRHYSAAMNAIQIHLPHEQRSRLTVAGSTISGATGLGLGYAYKFDDGLAVTVGVGTSGGEQVGVASVGFEFGADRVRSYNSRYNSMIDDVNTASRQRTAANTELINELRRELEMYREETSRCADELDRANEKSARIEERFMECLRK